MSTPREAENGPVRPEDLDVTLAVRRQLGADHEQAVIGEFLDRVGSAIDARVDARVAARPPAHTTPPQKPPIALPIVSVVSGIPISAIALGTTHGSWAGVLLMIISWVAIAGINVAYGRSR